MTSRPAWMRLDTHVFDNPKIRRAHQYGGDSALMLWLRGIAYSTAQLTDGWVPLPMPKAWGYKERHSTALEDAGLWIPLEITDDGGWIVNGFTEYQPTRQQWEERGQKMREAALKRWANRGMH